jgi:hypothetical protein
VENSATHTEEYGKKKIKIALSPLNHKPPSLGGKKYYHKVSTTKYTHH